MARLVFPSRLELKSLAGSFREAPLKKVNFTTALYDSPVQMPPSWDHTGVPIHFFDTTKWQLRGFGRYVTPIFPAYYQTRLNEFFQRSQPAPIDFGVGYRWRPNESNLMLAIKNLGVQEVSSSLPVAAPPPPRPIETAGDAARPVYRAPPARPREEPPPFIPFPFFLFGPPQPQ